MRKLLFRNCELTIGRWLREMTKCPYCNLEMDGTSDSCEFTHIKVNGEWFQRKIISYGGESLGTRCRECGIMIAPKHYHHFGCVNEECPKCWRSGVKCDCEKQALKKGEIVKKIE